MASNTSEFGAVQIAGRLAVPAERLAAPVARVRCVLRCGQRYLLAQHNSRRRENLGKWGLPGGRLKSREEPRAALRRELIEELGLRVRSLVEIGDWSHRGENHRIFGCDVARPTHGFAPDELLAVSWFEYTEVAELEADGRLRTGFELDAITAFRLRFPRVEPVSAAPRRRRSVARSSSKRRRS
jgi:8-oxo-dGTP pyrophosphatase MutT (NUDIX family)